MLHGAPRRGGERPWLHRYPIPDPSFSFLTRMISHENKHDACGHRHTEWKYQEHFHININYPVMIRDFYSQSYIYDDYPPSLGEALRRGSIAYITIFMVRE